MQTLPKIERIFNANKPQQKTPFTAKTFTIDHDIFADGITDGTRWNGWECPYFNFDEATKILSSQTPKNECIESGCTYYEISADGLHIVETSEEAIYVSDSIIVDGQRYFPIGRFCWVWEEVKQQEEDEQ